MALVVLLESMVAIQYFYQLPQLEEVAALLVTALVALELEIVEVLVVAVVLLVRQQIQGLAAQELLDKEMREEMGELMRLLIGRVAAVAVQEQ